MRTVDNANQGLIPCGIVHLLFVGLEVHALLNRSQSL